MASAAGKVTRVRLLGHLGDLERSQTTEGLVVKLAAQKPRDHALALEVQGTGLKHAPLPKPDTAIRPVPDGSLQLEPAAALLHGGKLHVKNRHKACQTAPFLHRRVARAHCSLQRCYRLEFRLENGWTTEAEVI